jgi:hypothetical protein
MDDLDDYMNFEEWMEMVDELLTDKIGNSSDSIPDFSWYDLYSEGFTPKEAFNTWCADDMFHKWILLW